MQWKLYEPPPVTTSIVADQIGLLPNDSVSHYKILDIRDWIAGKEIIMKSISWIQLNLMIWKKAQMFINLAKKREKNCLRMHCACSLDNWNT